MAVHWSDDTTITPAPPLSDERLAEIQDRLGVRLPADYVDVVRSHQGAAPDRTSVTLPDGTGTPFSMLLHLEDQPGCLNVLETVEWSEIVPDKVIPFAIDAGGNYFCFDYRCTTPDPPVVFLAHDEQDAQPERIAGSFTELIDSLQE